MRRRASRVDANQPAIVYALRAVGATVEPLHAVGGGCPDILVGYAGRNLLMEIKDGRLSPSRITLTEDQIKWHAAWRGQRTVVRSVDEALQALGVPFGEGAA